MTEPDDKEPPPRPVRVEMIDGVRTAIIGVNHMSENWLHILRRARTYAAEAGREKPIREDYERAAEEIRHAHG